MESQGRAKMLPCPSAMIPVVYIDYSSCSFEDCSSTYHDSSTPNEQSASACSRVGTVSATPIPHYHSLGRGPWDFLPLRVQCGWLEASKTKHHLGPASLTSGQVRMQASAEPTPGKVTLV